MKFIVAALMVVAACEGKSTPPSKTPDPPSAPAKATCKADSDCVISCESKDGCCHAPCCESALLASESAAISKYNAEHCPKNPDCPTVGGCVMDSVVTPHCKAGACVVEKVPRPDTRCKTTDDCAVVNMNPCDQCGCAQTPVAKTDAQRLKDWAASISCDQKVPDTRDCGECMPAQPACVNGSCMRASDAPPDAAVSTTQAPASTTCKVDDDCVISCESKGGCCHAHCCRTAVLASSLAGIAEYNAANCPKKPDCPTVGGCPDLRPVHAVCRAGKCTAATAQPPP